jgi:hypothetical protein
VRRNSFASRTNGSSRLRAWGFPQKREYCNLFIGIPYETLLLLACALVKFSWKGSLLGRPTTPRRKNVPDLAPAEGEEEGYKDKEGVGAGVEGIAVFGTSLQFM